ncbi:MAG TPA: cytochrome P450 [Nostocaceae cyanobacterium]|nr:cytochrome P450 [Nostocaceae cyanobacterium]
MLSSLPPEKNYDLLDHKALINPYPLYQQIRTEAPVYFYEKGGFWFLSRYQDVEAAFLDSRLSSHRNSLFVNQLQELDLHHIHNFTKIASNFLVDKDQPEHGRLKKISLPKFTAKALEIWRADIQSIINNLLDQVESRRSLDIVTELALKVPSLVITKILGIPDQEIEQFINWVLDISNFWGLSSSENVREIAQKADMAALNFTNFVNKLIAERQQQPGTDMISLLIASCRENGIDLEILPSLCVEIISAGEVTTSDIISSGVYTLLKHPQQLQKLKENPELINSAVEEIIRFEPPVQFVFRVAKENLIIGGKEITAGSLIGLGVGSANRDPEKFPNPDVFDITRSPNEHLGFGKGNHFCLGAVLARMELRTCFSTLLQRMPNLMLDAEMLSVVKRDSLVFKGFKSLNVTF